MPPRFPSARRSLLLPALLLTLAACTGPGPYENGAPPRTSTAADFIPGSNVVEVVVIDPLALDAAELVAPDGTTLPAAEISRSARLPASGGGGSIWPSVGVGVAGGSRSGIGIGTGIGIGFPLSGFGGSAPATVESRASIPVPDMNRYLADWQQWRVRLSFGGSAGAPRVVELAAPPPPAMPPADTR